ncbi:MAG: hypothetical protein AB8Y83_00295 [Coxiella endosymbiont of Haemaphysalis qinghaiensis]
MIAITFKTIRGLDIDLQLIIQKKTQKLILIKKFSVKCINIALEWKRSFQSLTIFLLLFRLKSDNHTAKEKFSVVVSEILKILCADAKSISHEKQYSIKLEADANLYTSGLEEELKRVCFGYDH